MCGRFALNVTHEDLSRVFDVPDAPELPPRFNVAPMQPVAAIRREASDPKNRLVMLRWGLVPSWAKDPSIGNRMINARAETVAEKPAFRGPFRKRRCLVLASGFYEWDHVTGSRQPWWIGLRGGAPFAMAALWDAWRDPEGKAVESCAVITTEANERVAAVHDRMPVILPKETWDRWLGPGDGEAQEILRPLDAARMEMRPISRYVNDPRHEGPACLGPAEGAGA